MNGNSSEDAGTKKRKLKIMKKLQKGDITTLDAYAECLQFGFEGKATLRIQLDKSRNDSRHQLNLSEIRSLLVSVIANRQVPKYFEVQNKPFIRNVMIVHVDSAADHHKILSKFGKVYSVRVSKNDTEVTFGPRRLLTISADDVSELFPKVVDEENNEGGHSFSIEDCVMSEAVMRTWKYPLLWAPEGENASTTTETTQTVNPDPAIEQAESEEAKLKRRRVDEDSSAEAPVVVNDADPVVGVRAGAGWLASRRWSAEYDRTTAESVCALIDATVVPGFALTRPRDSMDYEKLWDDSRSPETYDIVCVDCEMCDTSKGLELTRLTLLDRFSRVILDTLVKPADPIIDYRSQWSGITPTIMSNVNVTFEQARLAFLRIVSAETILVGHSVDSDLKALKILHNRCVDTAALFPHPKGFPMRRKLKVLAEQFLKIKIQRASTGHDSVEDARAALQLALLKAEKGPQFGVRCESDDGRFPLLSYFHPAQLSSKGSLFLWHDCQKQAELMQSCLAIGVKAEQNSTNNVDDTLSQFFEYFRPSSTPAVSNGIIEGVKVGYLGLSALPSSSASATETSATDSSNNNHNNEAVVSCIEKLIARLSDPALLPHAGGTLILLTGQSDSLEEAQTLQRRKRACTKVQAVSTWTLALEEQLKHAIASTNYTSACLMIV